MQSANLVDGEAKRREKGVRETKGGRGRKREWKREWERGSEEGRERKREREGVGKGEREGGREGEEGREGGQGEGNIILTAGVTSPILDVRLLLILLTNFERCSKCRVISVAITISIMLCRMAR